MVLVYGHFWKRRQIIAERLKERLARRKRRHGGGGGGGGEADSPGTGKEPAVLDPATNINNNNNSIGNNATAGKKEEIDDIGAGTGTGGTVNYDSLNYRSDARNCQDMEGEVGLTGIICRYDDETSSLGHSTIGVGNTRREVGHPSTTT
ncbi:hypothetical protein BG004_006765 [Podila humilis]|nr:hypothetical protein BG004_006765 [Podila humilis]